MKQGKKIMPKSLTEFMYSMEVASIGSRLDYIDPLECTPEYWMKKKWGSKYGASSKIVIGAALLLLALV